MAIVEPVIATTTGGTGTWDTPRQGTGNNRSRACNGRGGPRGDGRRGGGTGG